MISPTIPVADELDGVRALAILKVVPSPPISTHDVVESLGE